MKVEALEIPDVKLVTPKRFSDERGYFAETWNERVFAASGIDVRFVQDNESHSNRTGTVRGLHYQAPPFAQSKLVRVLQGAMLDVAVDARKASPTFGRWVGHELSEANKRQLWVPRGFAHGFVVTSETCDFLYKCTGYYRPDAERAVAWNDPALGIPWPVETPLLSGKDAAAPALADAPVLPDFRA